MEECLQKSRTKLKCKSHHHKLMRKYKSIPEIVKNLRPDLLGKKKEINSCLIIEDGGKTNKIKQAKNINPEFPTDTFSNSPYENIVDFNEYYTFTAERGDE